MLFLDRAFNSVMLNIYSEIYDAQLSDHPALYCTSIIMDKWKWVWEDAPPAGIDGEGFRGRVQHRYRMADVPGTIQRSVPFSPI